MRGLRGEECQRLCVEDQRFPQGFPQSEAKVENPKEKGGAAPPLRALSQVRLECRAAFQPAAQLLEFRAPQCKRFLALGPERVEVVVLFHALFGVIQNRFGKFVPLHSGPI